MGFVKQVMELGSGNNSIFTEDADSISGEFDIDNFCGTMSFNLPYYIKLPDGKTEQHISLKSGVNTNRLKKFDTCNFYFREFDSDPGSVYPKGGIYYAGGLPLYKTFTGFIDTIKLSKSKTNINYEIGALGTLGLANYKTLTYQKKTDLAINLFPTLLQISGLQQGQFNIFPVEKDIIPQSDIMFYDVDAENRPIVTEGGNDLKTSFDAIRKKYALIITQSGDGKVNIITPFYLISGTSRYVSAWKFDINNGTLYDIDYGDLTSQYQAVVVLGMNGIHGVAVDPLAVEANNGSTNYLTFENRDLTSEEDCQKVARDKLLEMERNQFFSFKTKFDPRIKVADPCTLIDNDRFTGKEILFIKKVMFNVSKTDVSANIQAFAHGATLIPEEIALSNTGVLDVDNLNIRDKELDTSTWRLL